MSEFSACESCSNYAYNEEFECYECLVNLDEDEYAKFISSSMSSCSYYTSDDEYKIVKKQM